jgi:hypothetical protein
LVPFQVLQVLPEGLLERWRELHHSVNDAKQVNDALFVPVSFVEQFDQAPFCHALGSSVALCLPAEGIYLTLASGK